LRTARWAACLSDSCRAFSVFFFASSFFWAFFSEAFFPDVFSSFFLFLLELDDPDTDGASGMAPPS
jgi:hypothetical protein